MLCEKTIDHWTDFLKDWRKIPSLSKLFSLFSLYLFYLHSHILPLPPQCIKHLNSTIFFLFSFTLKWVVILAMGCLAEIWPGATLFLLQLLVIVFSEDLAFLFYHTVYKPFFIIPFFLNHMLHLFNYLHISLSPFDLAFFSKDILSFTKYIPKMIGLRSHLDLGQVFHTLWLIWSVHYCTCKPAIPKGYKIYFFFLSLYIWVLTENQKFFQKFLFFLSECSC